MSLGGLTAIRLTAARLDLVRRLVLVDITPEVTAEACRSNGWAGAQPYCWQST
jgi:hypothetical protein